MSEAFLKGGQNGLNGHIMAAACAEIMAAWDEEYSLNAEPVTGQDWFDYFRATAESLANHKSPEELEKHYHGAFLLIKMTDESLETKH